MWVRVGAGSGASHLHEERVRLVVELVGRELHVDLEDGLLGVGRGLDDGFEVDELEKEARVAGLQARRFQNA